MVMLNYDKINCWLSLILKERFEVDFNIVREDNCLTLSLNGLDGKIIFDRLDSSFYEFSNTDKVKCKKWKASSEGFLGIIDDSIFMPYGEGDMSFPLFEWESLKSCKVHYDILGLVYWVMNRLEEIDNSKLDRFGRFDVNKSHAYIYGYLDRPIVDEWFDILKQIINRVWPAVKLKSTNFSFHISHDVDRPSRYQFKDNLGWMKSIYSDLKNGYIRDIFISPFIKWGKREVLNPRDPYNTFDWIIDISKKLGIKNSFYFISGGNTIYDADYSLDDKPILSLLKKIHNNGHEIGLHPSFDSYMDEEKLKQEFIYLKNTCEGVGIKQDTWGGRMHYLRWNHPETLRIWNNAGLKYDSTLGYATSIGFRCGTCHPFTTFNPVTCEILNIQEIPLIFMERMLVQDIVLSDVDEKIIIQEISNLIDTVRRVGGCFTFLWHNSNLRSTSAKRIYKNILEYLV